MPTEVVKAEDIRHLQSRVEQFQASAQLAKDKLVDITKCKESFSWWVVRGASSWASRPLSSAATSGPCETVYGLAELLHVSSIPTVVASRLQQDVVVLGAVHVRELHPDDWSGLPSWQDLRPLEQRRLLESASRLHHQNLD